MTGTDFVKHFAHLPCRRRLAGAWWAAEDEVERNVFFGIQAKVLCRAGRLLIALEHGHDALAANRVAKELRYIGLGILCSTVILVKVEGFQGGHSQGLTSRQSRLVTSLGTVEENIHLTSIAKIGTTACALDHIQSDLFSSLSHPKALLLELQVQDLAHIGRPG